MEPNLEVLIESFKQNHPKTNDSRPETVYEALQYLTYAESIMAESFTTATSQATTRFYTKQALNKIQESIRKENTFTCF